MGQRTDHRVQPEEALGGWKVRPQTAEGSCKGPMDVLEQATSNELTPGARDLRHRTSVELDQTTINLGEQLEGGLNESPDQHLQGELATREQLEARKACTVQLGRPALEDPSKELLLATKVVVDRRHVGPRSRRDLTDRRSRPALSSEDLLCGVKKTLTGLVCTGGTQRAFELSVPRMPHKPCAGALWGAFLVSHGRSGSDEGSRRTRPALEGPAAIEACKHHAPKPPPRGFRWEPRPMPRHSLASQTEHPKDPSVPVTRITTPHGTALLDESWAPASWLRGLLATRFFSESRAPVPGAEHKRNLALVPGPNGPLVAKRFQPSLRQRLLKSRLQSGFCHASAFPARNHIAPPRAWLRQLQYEYLLTDYIAAPNLEAELRRGNFGPSSANLAALAHFLTALHGAGFSHRDLRAANLAVVPGPRIVLLDLDDLKRRRPRRCRDLARLAESLVYSQAGAEAGFSEAVWRQVLEMYGHPEIGDATLHLAQRRALRQKRRGREVV